MNTTAFEMPAFPEDVRSRLPALVSYRAGLYTIFQQFMEQANYDMSRILYQDEAREFYSQLFANVNSVEAEIATLWRESVHQLSKGMRYQMNRLIDETHRLNVLIAMQVGIVDCTKQGIKPTWKRLRYGSRFQPIFDAGNISVRTFRREFTRLKRFHSGPASATNTH